MAGKSLRFISDTVRRFSTKPTTNGEINPVMFNRNPRNLERLRLERKPLGYGLEKTEVEFWHKLEVLTTQKYVVAHIVHNSNKVVISASTNERAIRKHLYSTKDRQAYIILANVFADRCLESGIISFYCSQLNDKDDNKVQAFLNVLVKEGLMLQEPSCYNPFDFFRKNKEKKPWTVLED